MGIRNISNIKNGGILLTFNITSLFTKISTKKLWTLSTRHSLWIFASVRSHSPIAVCYSNKNLNNKHYNDYSRHNWNQVCSPQNTDKARLCPNSNQQLKLPFNHLSSTHSFIKFTLEIGSYWGCIWEKKWLMELTLGRHVAYCKHSSMH